MADDHGSPKCKSRNFPVGCSVYRLAVSTMPGVPAYFLVLLLAASSASAQVAVDVRLEKTRHLAGEPVVVIVDIRNVGDEAVGYFAG